MCKALFAFTLVALAATNAMAESTNSQFLSEPAVSEDTGLVTSSCLIPVLFPGEGWSLIGDPLCEGREADRAAGYIRSNLELEVFKALMIKYGIKPKE